MLVAYTARFGETDPLRPPLVVDPEVRYLCFSDVPCTVEPYEWVPMPATDSPRLAARRIKILADHPMLTAADVTLWHDASYQLVLSPTWVLRKLIAADVVAMAHPRRVLIEQEAVAIARYGYLPLATADAYVAAYRAEGFTASVLTASGLLGRRQVERVSQFNALWWAQVLRWNGRDQASLNYAAWKAGVTIRHAKGTIKANRYAVWRQLGEVPHA
jgi:hypothetical protein